MRGLGVGVENIMDLCLYAFSNWVKKKSSDLKAAKKIEILLSSTLMKRLNIDIWAPYVYPSFFFAQFIHT